MWSLGAEMKRDVGDMGRLSVFPENWYCYYYFIGSVCPPLREK